jgi:predicted CoA-binding protein
MFANPPAQEIARLLREARVIAIVGLSADRTRPSHGVARALQRFGYRIIPVTPNAESILGEPAVATLEQLPEVLAADERVDIVDVFRRSEHVTQIVTDCIRLKLPALWLQEGGHRYHLGRARRAGGHLHGDGPLHLQGTRGAALAVRAPPPGRAAARSARGVFSAMLRS